MPVRGNPKLPADQMSADVMFDGMLPCDGIALASFDGSAADPAPIEVAVPPGSREVTFIINISALSGAGCTLTVTFGGWDPASASFAAIVTSAGLVGTGRSQYKFGNSALTSAGTTQNTAMPEVIQIKPVKSGTTTTLTYSVGYWFS